MKERQCQTKLTQNLHTKAKGSCSCLIAEAFGETEIRFRGDKIFQEITPGNIANSKKVEKVSF